MAEKQPPSQRETSGDTHIGWLRQRIPWDAKEVLNWLTIGGVFFGPVDRRLAFRDALRQALGKPVPKGLNWTYCLGASALFLFAVQVFTGILLALYYKPALESAYESVRHIVNDVRLGWLIKQVHAWSANLMIVVVFLHMLRVFFYGAYKAPRELTWMIGVVLLFLTLTFAFTGHLLPWNQNAYWATVMGTELVGKIPLIGQPLLRMMRGGEVVSGETLSRFYVVHVVILPGLATLTTLFHLVMVRRQGVAGPVSYEQ